MKHGISLGLALFSTWLLLSGHYTALLVSLGAVSVLLVLLVMRRMALIDDESAPVRLTLRFPPYVAWLIVEIAKANLDVVRRILGPRDAIQPEVIHVPASQKSELGQVIYANSITLTPGTVSIDARRGEITVHALSAAAVRELETQRMNRRVSKLENG